MPRIKTHFLVKFRPLSSIFNLQSKSMKFISGHFWVKFQGYSLTFWQKVFIFILLNHTLSISICIISGQSTKAIALPINQSGSFHHFSICNQTQSIWASFEENTMAFHLVQNLLNLITFKPAINSNQFHFLFNFGENNKPVALIFGQHSFIFITLRSTTQINQLELGSILGKIPRL